MPHHTALIADVKGSRQIENWPEVFGVLKKTLHEANKCFADQILVKFAPTVGDEFQGALKSPEKVYDIYTFIKASLPVPIYCGLGVGEVEMTSEGSGGLRGTAFYRAREALDQCKREGGLLRVVPLPVTDERSRLVHAVLRLMEAIESDWTHRQREAVSRLRLNLGLKQFEIAAQFRISEATLSKLLKAAHWTEINEGDQIIAVLLGHLDSPQTS